MVRITRKNTVPTKKPMISVVVTPELKTALEEWAADDGRTVSNLCERLLSKAVKERVKED